MTFWMDMLYIWVSKAKKKKQMKTLLVNIKLGLWIKVRFEYPILNSMWCLKQTLMLLMNLKFAKKKWQCFIKPGIWWERVGRRGIFIVLHAEDNNNRHNFPYWKYASFYLELLDDDECLSFFWFTKQDRTIRLRYIFGHPDTTKTLNCHFILCFTILGKLAELHLLKCLKY